MHCTNVNSIQVDRDTVHWWMCGNAAIKLAELHELREHLLAGRF
jgi:hypothetical protein